MTIQNAIDFIRQGQDDNALRTSLVKAENSQKRQNILDQNNLTFSPEEFDQAYHLTLFKCQEQEDADALNNFRLWWVMLYRSPDTE